MAANGVGGASTSSLVRLVRKPIRIAQSLRCDAASVTVSGK
jgi:hypothetical protein